MLSLAGIPLLLPDEDGELSKWLADNQDLRDVVQFGHGPMSDFATQRESRMKDKEQIGLPWYNWPSPPKPKLNTLYWPTGASRWAQGWFLANKEQKDAIVMDIRSRPDSDTDTTVTLLMGNEGSETVRAQVYLLPPRLINNNGLWLLPVVDQRYWWQFKDSGDWPVTASSSWGGMFVALGIELGVSIDVDPISTCYLQPDPTELTRRYYNPAVLLDAVASCVGQRIVAYPDGTVRSTGVDESITSYQSSLTEFRNVLAGGDFSDGGAGSNESGGGLPSTVRVTFPKYSSDATTFTDGERYYIDKDEAEGIQDAPEGSRKLIRSSARADFSSGGTVPTNWQELDNLACWIAYDYFRWQKVQFDYTFDGIRQWYQNGFTDAVVYEFGSPKDGGGWHARTRIQSLPASVGIESQLSQTTNVSSTTTTSSTSSGTVSAPSACDMTACGCVHTWNDLGSGQGEWNRPPGTPCTGTTTSSTTSGSCQCPVPQTTSTSSTSSTSGCACLWPTFCGTIDGQVAYTNCSTIPNSAPYCSSTTSTSTTSPTCDCTDTCSSKACVWEFLGFYADTYAETNTYNYQLVSSECEDNGCGACEQPSTCPTGRYATTYCSTTSDPGVQACECYPSWATYRWNPVTNQWDLTKACQSYFGTGDYGDFYNCCTSSPPPGTGTDCEARVVLCYKSTEQASSTTDPCYKYCHSTSSTSTTTNPCVTGSCLYQATHDTTAWVRLSTTCPTSCQCTEPTYTGCPDELVKVPCGSTTTTSTTSVGCPYRACQYECRIYDGAVEAYRPPGVTDVAWYVTSQQCGKNGDLINGEPFANPAYGNCCCMNPGTGAGSNACTSLADIGNVTSFQCIETTGNICAEPTTTSSSTTSTSTTSGGCGPSCVLQCSGGVYIQYPGSYTCGVSCPCTAGSSTIGSACLYEGEVVGGTCNTTSTTTTSTTTAGGSSSTTTTTTTSGI